VPRAGEVPAGKRFVCGDLLAEMPDGLVHVLATYRDGRGYDWADARRTPAGPAEADSAVRAADIDARWRSASVESERPRWSPVSVTSVASGAASRALPSVAGDAAAPPVPAAASAAPDLEAAQASQPAKSREGRFGSTFGSTVHHALALLVQGFSNDAGTAVGLAAARFGLAERLENPVADVERALAALQAEGLAVRAGAHLRVEYPVAGAWEGGKLVSGYVDVVAATADRLDVIDVKTDQPPPGGGNACLSRVRCSGARLHAAARGSRGHGRTTCSLRPAFHGRRGHSVGVTKSERATPPG
jgi:hypothetical protein